MTQIAATVVDGILKPDESLSFPDQTRVRLTIDPLEDDVVPSRAKAAWDAIEARLQARPINGGGVRYTRDQLHERG